MLDLEQRRKYSGQVEFAYRLALDGQTGSEVTSQVQSRPH